MTLYVKDIPLNTLLGVDKINVDNIERAATLCFTRRERFCDGYYVEKEIEEICNKFFGNTNVNQNNGLMKQYNLMKEYVNEHKLIGLFLIGMNLDNIIIDTYPTQNGTEIELTVKSICRCFLKSYFTQDEIHCICQATPNFDIYYDHVLEQKESELT